MAVAAVVAYVSLGCFWTSEHNFDCDKQLKGLHRAPDPTDCPTDRESVSDRTCQPNTTVVGYMGGSGTHPTYQNYTSAGNNFSETLRLVYDPADTTFSEVLDAFWQFAPSPTVPVKNPAHRLRIFFTSEAQRAAAAASIAKHNTATPGVLVQLVAAADFVFWKAEEYHQHYFEKSGRFCNTTDSVVVTGRRDISGSVAPAGAAAAAAAAAAAEGEGGAGGGALGGVGSGSAQSRRRGP